VQRRDVSRLRSLILAAANWIRVALGARIIDKDWHTETGWPVLALLSTTLPGVNQRGSSKVPYFGDRATIADPETLKTCSGDKNVLALELPLPLGFCRW
jgi:propionyl-CoA synthetase